MHLEGWLGERSRLCCLPQPSHHGFPDVWQGMAKGPDKDKQAHVPRTLMAVKHTDNYQSIVLSCL